MQSLVRGFIYSAGAILLFLATAMFLVNLTSPADLSPINDPIFHAPVTLLFWIAGGIALGIGAVCLLAKGLRLQLWLISLVAIGFLGSRISVSFLEVSNGFKGYLGPLADAFGIQAGTADGLLIVVNSYLLVGCLVYWLATPGGKEAKEAGEPTTKAA